MFRKERVVHILDNYPFKLPPYKHQKKALELGWERESFAYLMEMGTGKSKVLIDNVTMLYDLARIEGLLVISPKSVMNSWHFDEIPTHIAEHINYRSAMWDPNPKVKQKRAINRVFEKTSELSIFIMNIEGMWTDAAFKAAQLFILSRKCLIAIDESTKIKNPKAKRTLAVNQLSLDAPYRRILTGSPVTKSPLDLFAQCFFMDARLLGHDNQYSFRRRYAVTENILFGSRRVVQVVGFKNVPELTKKLSKFSYRVTKEQCLDLPPKIFEKRIVEMSKEQKQLYKEMRIMAFTELEGEQATTTAVITQLLRLHQIVCGHLTTDDGELRTFDHNRVTGLLDLLDETDNKVIIWANYRYDIKLIQKAIAKKYGNDSIVSYFGDTSQEERKIAIDLFQDSNSPVRFFLGNTQTGGYGITLTAANTVIYYSNNYDLEKRLQSEDRAHRIGQTSSVVYVDLICENTVDEKIIKALREKVNIANSVTGDQWRQWI
jgi:hypothetical protein